MIRVNLYWNDSHTEVLVELCETGEFLLPKNYKQEMLKVLLEGRERNG